MRDPRIAGDRLRQRRPFEADEVDVHARRGERVRVVQHAGAPSQVSERDNGGSHAGTIVRENYCTAKSEV